MAILAYFFFIDSLLLMISLLYVRTIVLYSNRPCAVKIDLKRISLVVFWHMNAYDYKNIEIGRTILNLSYFQGILESNASEFIESD